MRCGSPRRGADIIALDACAPIDGVRYRPAIPGDLAKTVEEIEKLGRRVVAVEADVRDGNAVHKLVSDGIAELGRIDASRRTRASPPPARGT